MFDVEGQPGKVALTAWQAGPRALPSIDAWRGCAGAAQPHISSAIDDVLIAPAHNNGTLVNVDRSAPCSRAAGKACSSARDHSEVAAKAIGEVTQTRTTCATASAAPWKSCRGPTPYPPAPARHAFRDPERHPGPVHRAA